ncbi:MAG: hypothetical protein EAZ73_09070 [Oscillatoriales cyanobacterium]|uniref:hypothetical protein n=1 Tax=unclassified Microcoleus TaxID=2642155 RepID=UPI001E13FEEA|nr:MULTISPECIES: hypothetical protein [unclassified Microcoleus]TAF00872.1 MAG: hypothetical protein EAZ79_01525 [Oscillatoriales cyanobacterium]MCC3459789.1 hypothetical protein [Microcoleus sp. PH2017_11_PCY_U_A]MCC3478222.1 hypothetical protein [Microcoleus sp. PH2017_12_PCY_D_A]TAF21369.1 MAG: hypothetical protein EAZ73_09070 [Oscillatoriales cyanobacterium]TAF39704.1 MAG: hypothetical protein EAZ69_00275 [Oscillatoriales cyanobacterium]
MKGIVYNCEILRCIPPKGIEIVSLDVGEDYFNRFGDRYQYCGGWKDFENMGIAVICAIELESDRTYTFVHPNVTHFQELVYSTQKIGSKICGFNSANFDDVLCAANSIAVATNFDLLEQVRFAAYGSTNWQDCPKGHSYKLDAIARANGFAKTGSGELAPKLWQQGKCQEIIHCCTNDVRITKELILLFIKHKLKDPNTGRTLTFSA